MTLSPALASERPCAYAAPDPHRAAGTLHVLCAEAAPRRAHPRERMLLQADALALSLAAGLNRVTPALARSAAAAMQKKIWFELGYARVDDYTRERLDRSGRWLRDLATLGRALVDLPGLEETMTGADGGTPVGQVEALGIARIATAATVAAWIDRAREVGPGRLREEIRAARRAGSSEPPAGGETAAPGIPASGGSARASTAIAGETDPEEDEPRQLVRYMVPRPVAAAFDEAVDLYRAVVGGEATVTSFVEALVGEALSGVDPPDAGSDPDADRAALNAGEVSARVEAALARSTRCWEHLPKRSEGSWALALSGVTLVRLIEIETRAGTGGAVELHDSLSALASLEDEIKRRLGRLLAEIGSMGGWSRLRFAGAGHYAERRLGLSRGMAEERLRVWRALSAYPVLRKAYEQGRLRLEATGRILRILRGRAASDALQRRWVGHASVVTARRMRDETLALISLSALEPPAALGESGSPALAPCDDASWRESLRREPGRSRTRILRLGLQAVARPMPDTFHRMRLPADLAAAFMACVESARRRLAREAVSLPPVRPSALAARAFDDRCRRVPAWVGLLAMLEDFVETWDDPRSHPRRPDREIHIRDGFRCTAPGCTSRSRLHVHHTRYRSHGGGESAANKCLVCTFHHLQGEHGELARCRGRAPLEVVWRLGRAGDGSAWYCNDRRL